MPWLDPDINDVIDDLAAAGRRGVIVVPIGFVSDHVEVVWDLDNEAAETAEKHGLFFARVRTPGTDPRFVAELADLVQERLGQAVPESAAAGRRRPPARFLRRRLLRELPGDPADDGRGRFRRRLGRSRCRPGQVDRLRDSRGANRCCAAALPAAGMMRR